MNCIRRKNGFITILGLLFVFVIIGVLYYIFLSRPPRSVDKPTQGLISQSGIDNSSYQSTLNSTLRKIKSMEQDQLKGGQDVNIFMDEMKRNQ